MGNGGSQPSGLLIEDKSIETSSFWSLHAATYGSQPSKKVSVFLGPATPKNDSALEKFAKNVMLYRHPNIVKYVGSWKVNNELHLVTEEVQPLPFVLSNQTPLQICIGLHSILKALIFLHEKAQCSHNNVCQAAVYVTAEGQWKLGGLDYLCRFNKMNISFLEESRKGRYERGISPDESKAVPKPLTAIDQYAFGILCEEILSKLKGEVVGMGEMLKVCRKELQKSDSTERPPLTTLLNHPFFSHQFIQIHDFLTELPLKTQHEKMIFFSCLIDKLREYDDKVVGQQLGGLLLSRLVLLDPTAQQHVLPKILTPKSEENVDKLLGEEVFRSEMVPRLISIFCVRDLQVRMTLLSYFSTFCSLFTPHQLQLILPELLLGIKEPNDELVAATLRSLADLVPILGSSIVIGGKRLKIFSDGRPKEVERTSTEPITAPQQVPGEVVDVGSTVLSERHSPDGGEMMESLPTLEEDLEDDTWQHWDSSPLAQQLVIPSHSQDVQELVSNASSNPSDFSSVPASDNFPQLESLDLKALEIKAVNPEEVNFFSDMEPVISRASVIRVPTPPSEKVEENIHSRLTVSNIQMDTDGWGEDGEWADVSENISLASSGPNSIEVD